jgi:hypothetical protein
MTGLDLVPGVLYNGALYIILAHIPSLDFQLSDFCNRDPWQVTGDGSQEKIL